MEGETWVGDVHRRVPEGDALDRLEAALVVSAEMEADADALVHHFVHEARRDAHSWTAIGERLGVSKQAARQRFVDPTAGDSRPLVPHPPRSTPRLIRCLEGAHSEAADAGAAEVGSEHLLLGLFREGVAANLLTRMGLELDAARAAARRCFPASGQPGSPPAASGEAHEAAISAGGMARRAGLDYVGTEHLLMALTLDPGSRARRVLQDLGADLAAIKRELTCFVTPPRGRHRRRGVRKFDRNGTCSFCGKGSGDGVELVAGPGVCICDDCIRVASEVVAERRR